MFPDVPLSGASTNNPPCWSGHRTLTCYLVTQDVLERLHADADAASARGSPKARSQPSLFRPGPEGHAAPADAFCQLEQRPRKAQGGNAAQQPGGAPRRTAIQDAPTALPPCPADPNVKVGARLKCIQCT